MLPSSTHLLLIPSYNPGSKMAETVRSARAQWNPVSVSYTHLTLPTIYSV